MCMCCAWCVCVCPCGVCVCGVVITNNIVYEYTCRGLVCGTFKEELETFLPPPNKYGNYVQCAVGAQFLCVVYRYVCFFAFRRAQQWLTVTGMTP